MKKIINIVLAALLIYLVSPKGGTIFYIKSLRWIYVLLVSFLITFLLMPFAIKWGERLGMLDHPNQRKVHDHPIPTSGGVAVSIAFFMTIFRNFNFSPQMIGVMIGTMIIFLTGVIDDRFGLHAVIKLFLQIGATTILIVYGIKVRVFPYGMPLKSVLDIVITYIGILGITNAFNYMDGMDGEAGGLAIVSGITLFLISMFNGSRHIFWMAIALVGCCLGFLPYNFPKAKVFLGDNGSTTIGFLLAAIAIAGSWSAVSVSVAIATPVLIFSIYIFDMTYTTVSRIRKGTVTNLKEWFAVTGKDHLHHRLVNLGFSKSQAVITIWACAAIFSFSAFVIRRTTYVNAILIILQCILIYFLIVVLMLIGREEKRPLVGQDTADRT
ncbi:MAG: undecaprenyl/decaprenyl-phosphate alpha-N-acetylglucosaminyl 1-phosphate transferase [Elusimicrobia bacterium]|nr:undecaprenyl/decaprenyl-phosphate alpha-N-acetylglucosaminyl 1-phosphate transferase [Elusimicrobiota bacterium]